jgi:hypothetical protein
MAGESLVVWRTKHVNGAAVELYDCDGLIHGRRADDTDRPAVPFRIAFLQVIGKDNSEFVG